MSKYPTNRVRGRKPHGGGMNKLEAAYAEILEARKLAGEVMWWAYEPITLRLAKRTGYTPDFAVLLADGLMQFVEVKSFWEDDARVKIKVVARQFWMFDFVAVRRKPKKDGGGWSEETFAT